MADLTPEQLLVVADAAGLRLLDEDVEPLTLQLNALIEGLRTLDAHDLVTDPHRPTAVVAYLAP